VRRHAGDEEGSSNFVLASWTGLIRTAVQAGQDTYQDFAIPFNGRPRG
jgi:hypothetical protein